MKDVRPVLVHEHAGLVVMIERVAGDVRAPVTDQDLLSVVRGESLRYGGTGKAGTHYQVVEH